MTRKTKAVSLWFVLLLTISTLIAPTASAQVSPIWSTDITDFYGEILNTHTNGAVTTSTCYNSNGMKTISAGGQPSHVVAAGSNNCNLSGIGSGGMTYSVIANDNPWASFAAGFSNGQQVWGLPFFEPCDQAGGYDQPLNAVALEVGSDGHVYTLYSDGSCGANKLYFIKINGQDGSQLVRRELPTPNHGFMQITSFGVVILTDRLHFLDFEGNNIAEIEVDPSLDSSVYSVTADGRVYLGTYEYINENSPCASQGIQTKHVLGYGVQGKFLDYELGDCHRITSIAATADSKIVLGTGYSNEASLFTITPDGALVSYRSFPMTSPQGEQYDSQVYGDLTADTTGKMVFRRSLTGTSGYIVEFHLLNPSNLNTLEEARTDSLSQASNPVWETGFAISPGRIYLALNDQCANNECSRKLHAVSFGGVGIDYLRGINLAGGLQIPAKKLSAPGDSFTAGLANPEYIGPSDVNGCRRSFGAWPRWLAADAQLNLTLSNEDFLACSGATTHDVRVGRNGEPGQLDRIPGDAGLVTMSIGGNDANFGNFAGECVKFECNVNSFAYQVSMANIDGPLLGDLTDLLEDVSNKAPSAKVLAVGYAYMIPKVEDRGANCPYLSDDELLLARMVTDKVNLRLKQAVQHLRDLGNQNILYVDPNLEGSPFEGHDICGNNSFFKQPNIIFDNESLHPVGDGVLAYKKIVKAVILANL